MEEMERGRGEGNRGWRVKEREEGGGRRKESRGEGEKEVVGWRRWREGVEREIEAGE